MAFENSVTWKKLFLRGISRLTAFATCREPERASEDLFILTCIINNVSLLSPLLPFGEEEGGGREEGRRGGAAGGALLVLFGSLACVGWKGG